MHRPMHVRQHLLFGAEALNLFDLDTIQHGNGEGDIERLGWKKAATSASVGKKTSYCFLREFGRLMLKCGSKEGNRGRNCCTLASIRRYQHDILNNYANRVNSLPSVQYSPLQWLVSLVKKKNYSEKYVILPHPLVPTVKRFSVCVCARK